MNPSNREPEGLMDTLGMQLEKATEEEVIVSLEVTSDHHQPAGYMHGGISLVLAETAASIGADVSTATDTNVFEMEINANHIKPFRTGRLSAVAQPLHRGKTSHVWEVDLRSGADKLICRSRCTLSVRKRTD